MSTYLTSGFVAAALAIWCTLSAWAEPGKGLPKPNPLPPPKAGTTEPPRTEPPPRSGDPIREKIRDGVRINEQLKQAREGDPNTTREAREDSKARAEAQLKADEARARAARVRDGVDTARDRAEDARVRAEVVRTQGAEQPNHRDRNFFRPAAVRSADIGLWFDRRNRDHLIITDVGTTGAIAKFGFREGDRILSVAGNRVVGQPDFMEYLFAEDLRAKRVDVIVSRNGREETVWVEPNVLIDDYHHVDVDPLEHFGVIADDRFDDRIVVWRVIPQSPAFYAGLRSGDVIVTFRGDKIAGRAEFLRAVRGIEAGEVTVQVKRDGRIRDFYVEVPAYVPRTERRINYLKPDVERLNERREERIEERREERRERAETRPALPGVTPVSPATEDLPKRP